MADDLGAVMNDDQAATLAGAADDSTEVGTKLGLQLGRLAYSDEEPEPDLTAVNSWVDGGSSAALRMVAEASDPPRILTPAETNPTRSWRVAFGFAAALMLVGVLAAIGIGVIGSHPSADQEYLRLLARSNDDALGGYRVVDPGKAETTGHWICGQLTAGTTEMGVTDELIGPAWPRIYKDAPPGFTWALTDWVKENFASKNIENAAERAYCPRFYPG